MTNTRVFPFFLLALTACTPASDPSASPRRTDGHSSSSPGHVSSATPRATKIITRSHRLTTRRLSFPLVSVVIADVHATMIVDTGATDHVLAGYFVRRLGLATEHEATPGTDAKGDPVAVERVVDAAVVLDGWGTIDTDRIFAAELPPMLDQLGVVGLLSPQRLASRTGAVVVDLRRGELRSALPDDLARAPSGSVVLGPPVVPACEVAGGGRRYVIPALVNGAPAQLEVDTGASRSDVLLGSAAGHVLVAAAAPSDSRPSTVRGSFEALVAQATVQAGQVSMTNDVALLPGSPRGRGPCSPDGAMGLDMLAGCVLMLSDATMRAYCSR